jgi:hypothetical protein
MSSEHEHERDCVDPKRELADESARTADAIDELPAMEAEKRTRPISTPGFHRLAEDITAKSREVFRIASIEERKGDESPRGAETIDDVTRDSGDAARTSLAAQGGPSFRTGNGSDASTSRALRRGRRLTPYAGQGSPGPWT